MLRALSQLVLHVPVAGHCVKTHAPCWDRSGVIFDFASVFGNGLRHVYVSHTRNHSWGLLLAVVSQTGAVIFWMFVSVGSHL